MLQAALKILSLEKIEAKTDSRAKKKETEAASNALEAIEAKRNAAKRELQETKLKCAIAVHQLELLKTKERAELERRGGRTMKKESESAKKKACKRKKLALFGVSQGKTCKKEGVEEKEPSSEYEIFEDDSSSHEDVICENCRDCMIACGKCMESTNCRQCQYDACEMDSVFISIECLVCDFSCFRRDKAVLAGVPFWKCSQFLQDPGNPDFMYSSTSIRTLNCCCLMQYLHPRGSITYRLSKSYHIIIIYASCLDFLHIFRLRSFLEMQAIRLRK